MTRAELSAGRLLPDSREVAVCFADLVDFTRLGERAGGRAGRGRRPPGRAGDRGRPSRRCA